MSRRVNQLAVALLAVILTLPAPSAFAARNDGPDRGSSIGQRFQHIIRVIRNVFTPGNNSDWPTPPKP